MGALIAARGTAYDSNLTLVVEFGLMHEIREGHLRYIKVGLDGG